MPITTIDLAADYILDFAHEYQAFISNLKLQKLLYYAQAWHLALKGQPLFVARFEAWIHGPVNPEMYQKYKAYGYKNIDADVKKPIFDTTTEAFMQELLEEYFPLDAYELERLTHQEAPWIEARNGLSAAQPSHAIISEDSMRQYYQSQIST